MDAQYISDAISRGLNSKQFNDHEDEVKRRAGYCKGNERWVSGTTEVINVEGNLDGMTFTGRVKLKYHADYKRKIFHGFGCEYDTEDKNCSGESEAEVRLSILGQTLTNYTVINSDPSTAHDSTRMCNEGIRDLITNTIRTLS